MKPTLHSGWEKVAIAAIQRLLGHRSQIKVIPFVEEKKLKRLADTDCVLGAEIHAPHTYAAAPPEAGGFFAHYDIFVRAIVDALSAAGTTVFRMEQLAYHPGAKPFSPSYKA